MRGRHVHFWEILHRDRKLEGVVYECLGDEDIREFVVESVGRDFHLLDTSVLPVRGPINRIWEGWFGRADIAAPPSEESDWKKWLGPSAPY